METTEKWSKKDGYNTKYYTKTEAHGRFAMPILKATNYKPDMLIGFNEMLTTKRNDCGIHFFLDDYQFERVWRRPEYYLSKMRDFQCIFTPDFSLYTDMAIPVQIWNVYRSRLIGQIAQKKGLTVIPTVSWSTEDSFQFCFDGLPKDGTVAISTIGIKKGEKLKLFSAGVEAMIDKIRPNRILIYGGKVDCNYQGIETVYYDNNVTERLHKLKKEEKHGGSR